MTGPHGVWCLDESSIEELVFGKGPSVEAAWVREDVVCFVVDVGAWMVPSCIGTATSEGGGVSSL